MRSPTSTARAVGRALVLTLASVICTGPHAAEPAGRTAVTELKPLLARAAAEGRAQGVLTGPGAQAIARRFKTDAAIEIDVRRLQPLPQAGCARLEVSTRQHKVMQGPEPSEQQLVYQISFCADGRFPGER
jgi:hypothetical protein